MIYLLLAQPSIIGDDLARDNQSICFGQRTDIERYGRMLGCRLGGLKLTYQPKIEFVLHEFSWRTGFLWRRQLDRSRVAMNEAHADEPAPRVAAAQPPDGPDPGPAAGPGDHQPAPASPANDVVVQPDEVEGHDHEAESEAPAFQRRKPTPAADSKPTHKPLADDPELYIPARSSSEVWLVFRLSRNPTAAAADYAYCLGCKQWISYKSKTPSNLAAHLRGCQLGMTFKQDAEKKKLASSTAHSKKSQPTLSQFATMVAEQTVTQVEAARRSVMNFIADCTLPLSTVDQPSFVEMLKTLNPSLAATIPKRTKMTQDLNEYFQKALKALTAQLKTAKGLAFTSDAATTISRTSLFAVTVHYIDEDWNLQSVVLALKELSESHTAVNISELIKSVIDTVEADPELSILVTDGAANMLASSRALKQDDIISDSLSCFCHTLNLAVTQALDHPDLAPLLQKCNSTINGIRNSTRLTETFIKAQLDEKKEAVQLAEQNQALSAHQLGLLEKTGSLTLIKDVVTRWWSTSSMLTRLLLLKGPVAKTLRDHNNVPITDSEWKQIEDIVFVLKPFSDATRTLEGERYPTLSSVLPVLAALVTFILGSNHAPEDMKDDVPDWSTYSAETVRFKNRILAEMGKDGRFDQFPSAVRIAAAVDPRYHSLSFVLDRRLKGQIREQLKEVMLKVQRAQQHPERKDQAPAAQAAQPGQPAPAQEAVLQPKNSLANLMKSKRPRQPAEQSNEDEVDRELEKLLLEDDTDDDPLVWWRANAKRFPILSVVARMYLCVPASSAPSERTFSKLNVVVTKRRNRLKVKNIEALQPSSHGSSWHSVLVASVCVRRYRFNIGYRFVMSLVILILIDEPGANIATTLGRKSDYRVRLPSEALPTRAYGPILSQMSMDMASY